MAPRMVRKGSLPVKRGISTVARLYEGHVNAIKLVVALSTSDQCGHIATIVQEGTLLGVWGADSKQPVEAVTPNGVSALAGIKAFA